MMRILAIDPGREKSGIVAADDMTILDRSVVSTTSLARVVREWRARYGIEQVIIGDRTGKDEVRRILAVELTGLPVAVVEEGHTTLLARQRYFADHPARGWRRLLPVTMQVPPEPYDDYAAQVILERFLEGRR